MSKKLINGILFIVGLGILALMAWNFGWENILENIQKTGWWFIPVIATWIPVYLMNTRAWQIILAQGKISFMKLFSYSITGFALNYITPVVGLGGEPYKVMLIRDRYGIEKSTSSIVLYNMLHMLSHFFFWLTAVLMIVFVSTFDTTTYIILAISFLIILGLIILFYAGHRKGVIFLFLKILGSIPGLKKMVARLREHNDAQLRHTDELIIELYNRRRGAFYRALLWEYLARIVSSAEFYFIMKAISIDVSFLEAIYISAGSSLIANIFFFIPLQLGTRESGLYLVFQSLGLTASTGIFVSLVTRIREFFWILVGLVLSRFHLNKTQEMNKLKVKNILFDFGGTLDTNGIHWSEMFWDAYVASGANVEKPEYEKAYVQANKEMVQGHVKTDFDFRDTISTQIRLQLENLANYQKITAGSISMMQQKITDLCYQKVEENIENSRKILTQLKSRNYRLGLVSNFHGNMPTVLQKFGLTPFFDVIVDSTLAGVSKPDPEIFRKALNEMDIKAEETAVVGDSYTRDIEASRKAGCKTIWLKGRSWKAWSGNETADIITDDITKLLNIL